MKSRSLVKLSFQNFSQTTLTVSFDVPPINLDFFMNFFVEFSQLTFFSGAVHLNIPNNGYQMTLKTAFFFKIVSVQIYFQKPTKCPKNPQYKKQNDITAPSKQQKNSKIGKNLLLLHHQAILGNNFFSNKLNRGAKVNHMLDTWLNNGCRSTPARHAANPYRKKSHPMLRRNSNIY